MFIIYVLIVKRKAFAEFYEKISWVNFLSISSSYTPAIMTAHPPPRKVEVCLFVHYGFYEFMGNDCLYRI